MNRGSNPTWAITLGFRLLLGGLATLPLVACNGNGQQAAQGAYPPMPVSVMTARQQTLPVPLEAVGQAEGSREVEVRARVSGLLEQTLYEEGQALKAGAPMFQIERAPFEIALQQARATLAQRQAQLDQTHREALRLKPLAEEKAIAQREYDDAVSNERLASAALASAQAGVREAELNLSYTSIKAPIPGITGRSLKSQGSLVTAGSDSLLTTLVQTDPIWVRFSLSETELALVREARKPEVRLLSADGKVQLSGGRLNFAASTVDTRIGTVQLRAEFGNHALSVLPGQFVRVQVLAGQVSAFKVPQSALIQTEQGRMVWLAKGGKAVAAPVEAGAWAGHEWIVHKGLTDGDQLIIDNLMKLRPDALVTPQGATAPTSAAVAASAASR